MIREKGKMEKILVLSSCLLAVLVSAAAFMWGYGSAVPLMGIGNLKITQTSIAQQNPTINVSGQIIDSSQGVTITKVSQRRRGSLIIIVVRKGYRLGRPSTGKFSLDVSVPSDVDTLAFGTSRDVIWHR